MFPNELDPQEFMKGWERYPSNLSTIFPLEDNLELYDRRLHNDAQRLFNPNETDVRFHTLQPGSNEESSSLSLIDDAVNDVNRLEEVLVVRSTLTFSN